MMKKITCLICCLMSFCLIASCARPIPSPGAITIEPSFLGKHSGAAGSLLGRTLYIQVTKANNNYQSLVGKTLVSKFVLGSQYKLYKHERFSSVISEGSYLYNLDAYHVNQAHLVMLGKNGLNFTLLFTSEEGGIFYARSNTASVDATLTGTFILKYNN